MRSPARWCRRSPPAAASRAPASRRSSTWTRARSRSTSTRRSSIASRPNQKTEAVLDAYPDWVIPSHVINIVPTADRQKATVRVRIGFDTLDPRILPDMGVKVSFLDDRASRDGAQAARRDPRCAFPRRQSFATATRASSGACRTASSSASRCAPAASATARSKCCRASMPATSWSRRRSKGLSEGAQVKSKRQARIGRGESWRHLVRLRGVAKDYKRGAETVHVLHALDLDIPKGRFPRADGAVRLRQVDAAEPDRRPRPAEPPARSRSPASAPTR